MANCVDWEWCVSEVEWLKSGEFGDVIENEFGSHLWDFRSGSVEDALSRNVVMERVSYDHDDLESIRLNISLVRFATIDREVTVECHETMVGADMKLPEETDGGYRIPKRLHEELARKVAEMGRDIYL